MDLTALQAAVSTLSADFTTFSTDVTAKLAALEANQQNPTDAQTIATVVSGLGDLDTKLKALDASLNPPAPPAGS